MKRFFDSGFFQFGTIIGLIYFFLILIFLPTIKLDTFFQPNDILLFGPIMLGLIILGICCICFIFTIVGIVLFIRFINKKSEEKEEKFCFLDIFSNTADIVASVFFLIYIFVSFITTIPVITTIPFFLFGLVFHI